MKPYRSKLLARCD